MYIFGIHIPFTSYKTTHYAKNELPIQSNEVEVITTYHQGNYITELRMDAILCKDANENYYWQGTCGIMKGRRFLVQPNDRWEYID